MTIEQPWTRWRTGERVCVVCGAAPVASVDCPPPWLPPINLASFETPWRVPVCADHDHVAAWPTRMLLAICDEHRAVNESQPGQLELLALWDLHAGRQATARTAAPPLD